MKTKSGANIEGEKKDGLKNKKSTQRCHVLFLKNIFFKSTDK